MRADISAVAAARPVSEEREAGYSGRS
jgi:hypothetical protein